jgi:hypothetical protein
MELAGTERRRSPLFPVPNSADWKKMEGNLRTNYEKWMTWIVLSLCGMLLLIGGVNGALVKG